MMRIEKEQKGREGEEKEEEEYFPSFALSRSVLHYRFFV